MMGEMKAGDLVRLTNAASVQFFRPITVRVIREFPERYTYEGWVWIEGYELNAAGDAVARRELFVMRGGVRVLAQAARTASEPRRPIRRAPVRVG